MSKTNDQDNYNNNMTSDDDDSDIEFFADECVFLDDEDITLAQEVSMVDESVIVYDHDYLTKFVSKLIPPISWRDSEFAQAKRISNIVDILMQHRLHHDTTVIKDRYHEFVVPIVNMQRYISNEKSEETVMLYDGDKSVLESLKKYFKRMSERFIKESYPSPFVMNELVPEIGNASDVVYAWRQTGVEEGKKIFEVHRVLNRDKIEVIGLCNIAMGASGDAYKEYDVKKYHDFVGSLQSGDAIMLMYNFLSGNVDGTDAEPGVIVAATSDALTIKGSRSKTEIQYNRASLARLLLQREFTLGTKDGTVHFNHRMFWTTRALILLPSREYIKYVLPYYHEWHQVHVQPDATNVLLSSAEASSYIQSHQDYKYFTRLVRDNIEKLAPVAVLAQDPGPQPRADQQQYKDIAMVAQVLRQDIERVKEGQLTNDPVDHKELAADVENERRAIATKVDGYVQDAGLHTIESLRQVYTRSATPEPALFWHAATLRVCSFVLYGNNLGLIPGVKDTSEHAHRLGLLYDDKFLMVWSAPLIRHLWRRLLIDSVPRRSLAATNSKVSDDDTGLRVHIQEVEIFARPFQLPGADIDTADEDIDEYNTVRDAEDDMQDYEGQGAEDGEDNYDMDDEPQVATEVLEYGADLSKVADIEAAVDADTVLSDIHLADGAYTPEHMLWTLITILKLRLSVEENARAAAYMSLRTPLTEAQYVNKRKRLIAVLSKTFPPNSNDHRIGLQKIDEALTEQRTSAYRQLLFDGCAYLIVLVQCSFPATRIAASVDLFGYPLTDRNTHFVDGVSTTVLDNLSKIDSFSFLTKMTASEVQNGIIAATAALLDQTDSIRKDMARARERLQIWEEQSRSYGVWETFRPFLERVSDKEEEEKSSSCLKKLLVRADEKIADKVTSSSCCANKFSEAYWEFIDPTACTTTGDGTGAAPRNNVRFNSARVLLDLQRQIHANDITHATVDQAPELIINIPMPPNEDSSTPGVASSESTAIMSKHEQAHMDELRACIQRLSTIFPNKKGLEFLSVVESPAFSQFECLRDCTAHLHRMMQRSVRTKMLGTSPLNAQQQQLFKSLASSIKSSNDVYDLVQLVLSIVRIALESTQTTDIPDENEFAGVSKIDHANVVGLLNDMFGTFIKICSLQVLVADTDAQYENDRELYKQKMLTLTKSLQYDARFVYRELKARGVDVLTYLSALTSTTPSATDL